MRWFIVFLIVANVILFFWVKQQSQPVSGTSALPPPDIGRLRLLSESEEDGEEVASGKDDGEKAPIDTVAQDVPPVEPVPTATEPVDLDVGVDEAPHVEPVPQIAIAEPGPETVPASPGLEEAPADGPLSRPFAATENAEMQPETAAPAPEEEQPEAERQRVEQVAQMTVDEPDAVILEEQDQARELAEDPPEPTLAPAVQAAPAVDAAAVIKEAADDVEAVAAQAVTTATPVEEIAAAEPAAAETAVVDRQEEMAENEDAAPAAPAPVCERIGPFEPEDADRLIERLPKRLELVSDDSEEYASVDRYYVLIPPLPSRSAGRRKLRELADAGFTDTWLFPSGEYRNAISMGYFSRESRAKAHATNIAKKGFEAEVREKTTLRQRRWLVLKGLDGEGSGSRLTLPKGAVVEPRPCP